MHNRLLILFLCCGVILSFVSGHDHKSKHGNKHHEESKSDEDEQHALPKNHKHGGIKKLWRRDTSKEEDENWKGRWMPSREGEPTPPPKILHKTGVFKDHNVAKDPKHLIGMGVQSKACDDGKTHLRVDWNWSPVNYTCYDDKIVPDFSINPMIYCEHIPKSYVPVHKCMTDIIEYDDDLPIYGSHRPVWPVYGEYKFLPKQRWIHSLEHGGIVMLYHPCANPQEVKLLKKLVSGCLRRHIISPYTVLDEKRPLALLSWGCRLTMSYVNPKVVRDFIVKKAIRGPEPIYQHGAFSEFLIRVSKVVSDKKDTILCP